MKRQQAQKRLLDTAVKPVDNAELYKAIGSAASKVGMTMSDVAMRYQDKQDEATMMESASNANIQMMETTQAWRVENESDPSNPKALSELDKSYRDIYGQYSDKVSLSGKGKWSQTSNAMVNDAKEKNTVWGIKQGIINAETNINNSIENNLEMGKVMGMSGDVNEAMKIYGTSRVALKSFSEGIFSTQKMDEILKDYESDYMEAFVSGMLENDPEGALDLLKDERVLMSLDSKDREETLTALADKRTLEIDHQTNLDTITSENEATSFLASDEVSLSEKYVSIATNENMSPEYKKLATIYLKSKAAVKPKSGTPEETELIRLSAALKNMLGKDPNYGNSENFLNAYRDLNNLSMKYLGEGKVAGKAVDKIKGSLNNTLADASRGLTANHKWGYDEKDADEYFKENLGSNVYGDEALREFYYQTDGKKLSGEESESIAFNIKNKINSRALSKVSTSVDSFGVRADGTKKGKGFLGILSRPDGGVSTEISIGVEIDGKETEIPTLVPTLTAKEKDYLLKGKKPTRTIIRKAVTHAKERIKEGKSPFKEGGTTTEEKILPAGEIAVGTISFGKRYIGGDRYDQKNWEKI